LLRIEQITNNRAKFRPKKYGSYLKLMQEPKWTFELLWLLAFIRISKTDT